MKTLRELREKTLTPAEKKKREEIAKAMEKDNPDMPMDKKMAIATATAKRVAEYGGPPISRKAYLKQKPMSKELDEGRMKELHGYIDRGMSAQQIAKKMKLDVKTIQALMPKKESIEEDRKGMAKLAGLYSKAMRQMPGSPAQKKIKAEIDKLRKELGMNESLEEAVKLDEDGHDDVASMKNKVKIAMSALQKMQTELGKLQDSDSLPSWWTNKVAIAVDKLDGMADYIDTQVESIGEAVKTTHVVIDTADGNKVVATASSEQGAKSSVASAERPPINIKNKRTLKIVKLKRPVGDKQVDRMVGYPLKEAVSPAQQAAIAIAKKEKGEKPEVKEAKDDLFQVNVKGEGGATVRAKSEKDAINKAFRKLGIATRFTRDRRFMTKVQVVPAESVEESRAYRDAMRGMKGNTKGMATTKKDRDDEASDDDRKAASKNIIMQLRKAADLSTGANIEFERGKGKVDRATAQNVLAKFNRLQKPMDKEKFQNSIKSLADIKKILGR